MVNADSTPMSPYARMEHSRCLEAQAGPKLTTVRAEDMMQLVKHITVSVEGRAHSRYPMTAHTRNTVRLAD